MAAARYSRTDYNVAWICTLPDVELLPARLMLDERHDPPSIDTTYDDNTYVCGTIKGHRVVIATLPKVLTGNVNAGRLTGSLFKSFPNIKIALLVGIGGGVPRSEPSNDPLEDIHLGDVVVGWPGDGKPGVIYHELGRAMVNDEFEMVGTMDKPEWRLLQALGVLSLNQEMEETTFPEQLARLQGKPKFAMPDVKHDRLFQANYHHIGDKGSSCESCDHAQLVQRPARTDKQRGAFVFHQGRIAISNSVVRDGELRDEISKRCGGVLCVEMEAAGVEINGRCLVIRGISDYADSHKNDMWKHYAAGNAAAFARELLCTMQAITVRDMGGTIKAPWRVPFPRNLHFVGRETEIQALSQMLLSSETCERAAIWGRDGYGKTAIALEFAYRTRKQHPRCAVFWVPAISRKSFLDAYRDIGVLLRIPNIQHEDADVKQLVRRELSSERSGEWLMVVDNADNVDVLFQEDTDGTRLVDCLPNGRRGSLLFTTRTRKAAIEEAGVNTIQLLEMNQKEARNVLENSLLQKSLLEDHATDELLETLWYMPLAIVQAAAFINENDISISKYMSLLQNKDEAFKLLKQNFEGHGRYQSSFWDENMSDDASSDGKDSLISEATALSMQTGSSKTLVSTGLDPQIVARWLADRLMQESELKPLYQKAFKTFDETFRDNHNRLLGRLFADLRKECGNDVPRKETVKFLGGRGQRELLTAEISALSVPNRSLRRALDGLESVELDSMNRINNMLKEMGKGMQHSSKPEHPDPPEREGANQHNNPAEDNNNNDSDSNSSLSDDDMVEEGQRKMEDVESMFEFLLSGVPFNRYRSRLNQLLFPPTTFRDALQYGNKRAAKGLIRRDFETVRESFPLLAMLGDEHSPSQMIQILFGNDMTDGVRNFETSESFFLDHSIDPEIRKKDTTRFQLQVLRSSIQRVVCSIPIHRIWFTREDDVGYLSWSNQLKLFVEGLTGAIWLWWPLSHPMKKLWPNQSRLNWVCNCGKHVWEDTTIEEAAVIQDLLKKRVGTPSRSIYCRKGSINPSLVPSIWKSICQSVGGSQIANQSPPPRAYFLEWCSEHIYPRVRRGWSRSSTVLPLDNLNNIESANYATANQGQTRRKEGSLWALLGTPNSQPLMEATEIEIDMDEERCDWNFYRSLRKRYRDKRGLLRLWFSCWQLSHCDFVEVARPQKLAHRSKSLPSDLQYDYQPRPPLVPTDTAITAPISPHEFQDHFSACDGNCSWPIFHDCIQPFSGNSDVESIPKKKSAFDLDSKEKPKLWGLQIVYSPSFIHIFIYHVIFLVFPFGFWAFWQAYHPDDVSNAAVPTSVFISFLSCFWGFAGAAGGFKKPGST